MKLRINGALDRSGVEPGKLFAQQLLREKEGVDPRTLEKNELGLIVVPIKGNPRAKTYLRPNKDLQVVDLNEKPKEQSDK